jgi:hypothetical protein
MIILILRQCHSKGTTDRIWMEMTWTDQEITDAPVGVKGKHLLVTGSMLIKFES